MAELTLYGLPTCDTCRKARKALEGAGHSVAFRDVRMEPLSEAEWQPLLAEFGDRLVNRTSTTYRGFNEFLRAAEAEDQLREQPSVMKRPVITDGARWTLGWDAEAQAAWGL